MSKRRVVVTGLGPVSPIGTGKDRFWTNLRAGEVGIARIEAFDPSEFRSQVGGEVKEFKPKQHVPKSYRKSTKLMARDIEMAVVASDCAVRDSGLKTKGVEDGDTKIDSTRLGVNIGGGLICPDLDELTYSFDKAVTDGQFSLKAWGADGIPHLTPLWLLKYLPNMLGCHVSIIHDAQAPSNTITCAEASSQLAIGEAVRVIGRDSADAVLCGGAETKINPMGLLRQDLIGRLTQSGNDNPATAVKPFDKDRDGTAIAEGGAVIVLEELEHAGKRGANIYCEVAGFGSAFGTADLVLPEPKGEALSLAIEKAMNDAGVGAGDIDLVVGFGCGTVEHDRAEAIAIRRTLGDVPVTSIKGQLGNNGAGSGALDVAAAALCLSEGFVPKTVNCENIDEECPVNVVTDGGERKVNVVLTLSYSLGGGQVAALVLRRFEDRDS